MNQRSHTTPSPFCRYLSFVALCCVLFLNHASIAVFAAEDATQNDTVREEKKEQQPKKEEKVEFPEHKW